MAILKGRIRNARRRAHVRSSVPLSPPGATDDANADGIEVPVAATQGQRLDLNDVMAAH
jgi:hypothetical protein